MTMITHRVVRLHGDEDWETWGDTWHEHVDTVENLRWFHGPNPSGPRRQLDWGASLTEATIEEIRLAFEPPAADDTDWSRKTREALSKLVPTERYGVIRMEEVEELDW